MEQLQLHPLIVGSEELIPPDDLAQYSAALEEALSAAGVGTVGVRARFPVPNEWHLRSIIHVSVTDLEAGVRVLRRTLRAVGVPEATWIWQWEPEFAAYEVWGFSERDPPTWGW